MSYSTSSLEEVDSEDTRSRIIELFHQNKTPDPENRYDWLYRSKYACENHVHQVLLHNQTIVGIGSCLSVPADDFRLASFVNLLVDEQHRTLGPALKLERELIERACEKIQPDMLIVRPNKRAEPLYKRLKFKPLTTSPRHSWISNPLGFIPVPARLKRLSGTASSAVLKPWLWTQSISSAFRSGVISDPYRWAFHDSATSALDRVSSYHRWRYVDMPNQNFRAASCDNSQGDKAPVIIFDISPHGVLSISDFLNITGHTFEHALVSFMTQAMTLFKPRNFTTSITSPKQLEHVLRNLGFVRRVDGTETTTFVSSCRLRKNEHQKNSLSERLVLPARLDF